MCDKKITQTPLKSRLFKFKSHPHGVFYVWHLLKSHYEKWVQKSPEALRHLGFLGWHPLRMHNMVAEMGFEPHDLRVMSPASDQTAPLRDIWVPEAGVEPVREKISRDFKSRASANSATPAYRKRTCFRCLSSIAFFFMFVNTFEEILKLFAKHR